MISRLWRFAKTSAFVGRNVELGQRFHIGLFSFVSAPARLTIGDDVYIGKFCSIQCSGRIGNGVLIANNVGIVGRRDHDIRQTGVPIRLANWVGEHSYLSEDPKNFVVIEDDVWLGYGSIVVSGLTIGRGAIVAAGAVVNNDVGPYEIVAGNPARCVGHRFTEAAVREHEAAFVG